MRAAAVLTVLVVATAAAAAEPDPMAARAGVAGGGALALGHTDHGGGGGPSLGFAAWLGYAPTPRLTLLARWTATIVTDGYTLGDVSLAARARRGRLYLEPHLGIARERADGAAGFTGPSLGLTPGVELVHRPRFAVDLRLGVAWHALEAHADHVQVLGSIALTAH